MRIQTLAFCALLAFAPAAGAADDSWLTSVDEAFAAAEDGDRYVLVDLYAEWCGWCQPKVPPNSVTACSTRSRSQH